MGRRRIVVATNRISRQHVRFVNHGRLLNHDGRRPVCGDRLTADASLLHRGDDVLANALLVQGDDVRHLKFLSDAALVDLIDDHRIAQPAAGHVDDVADRHGGHRLHDALGLLLLLLVVLLLLLGRPLLVVRVAQDPAGDGPDDSADRRTGTGFVVVIADDPAGDRAGQTAQRRATLFALGRRGVGRTGQDDRKTQNGSGNRRSVEESAHGDSPLVRLRDGEWFTAKSGTPLLKSDAASRQAQFHRRRPLQTLQSLITAASDRPDDLGNRLKEIVGVVKFAINASKSDRRDRVQFGQMSQNDLPDLVGGDFRIERRVHVGLDALYAALDLGALDRTLGAGPFDAPPDFFAIKRLPRLFAFDHAHAQLFDCFQRHETSVTLAAHAFTFDLIAVFDRSRVDDSIVIDVTVGASHGRLGMTVVGSVARLSEVDQASDKPDEQTFPEQGFTGYPPPITIFILILKAATACPTIIPRRTPTATILPRPKPNPTARRHLRPTMRHAVVKPRRRSSAKN